MKQNILIIQNNILHYRKALYNSLSKYYNVTVIHSGKPSIEKNDKYKEIIVKVKKIGPFYFQEKILTEVKKEKYDVIITMFDIRWINNLLSMYFYNKKSKFIWWGAWLTKSKIANTLRIIIMKYNHNNILYTEKTKKEFIKSGINSNILYVANNTFDVGERIKSYKYEKKYILFVGSLDERKQLEVVINAYKNILNKIPNFIEFIIIGDGKERNFLETLAKKYRLQNRVFFQGKITDVQILKNYYKNAIFSVSFGQAGLSVLQSLGYGVPFVTKINAISGGEITNIKHNFNGILCKDDIKSLEEYMIKLCNNIEYSKLLGENAYNYYSKYCTINNMVQGFKKAIEE